VREPDDPLDDAVKLLKPFPDDATRESARAEIEGIILDYRDRAAEAAEESPRPAEVARSLARIEAAAAELRDALAAAPLEARERVSASGPDLVTRRESIAQEIQFAEQRFKDDPRRRAERIATLKAIDADQAQPEDDESDAVRYVESLRTAAASAREDLPRDRGGKVTLATHRIGPLRLWLALHLLALHDRIHPDEATATAGGPFHRFFEAALAFAEAKPVGNSAIAPVKLAVEWLRVLNRQADECGGRVHYSYGRNKGDDEVKFQRVTVPFEYVLHHIQRGSKHPARDHPVVKFRSG
jgi:hypothetical protein